ncbi:hypothetical protein FXO38_00649 [Capsicum annuum]|nr:hypothetical protein FXO38_00649 [Capsicum annuum]
MDDTVEIKGEAELADMLQKRFKGKRYLIVLDDMWKSEAWDAVRLCFPSENKGSRILLTARNTKVACDPGTENLSLQMGFIDPYESWNLFKSVVFANESLPYEFETTGKQIADERHGLPITIVVVAGLLKSKRAIEDWRCVAKNVNSLITNDPDERCSHDDKCETIFNGTNDKPGKDNLGRPLRAGRPDAVYTLMLTIIEHFGGRFTNQYENIRTLLKGLKCKHLGEFRWYKDTFLSRVMDLPKSKYDHWKAKFIDGLPSLFAEKVRKSLRGSYGEVQYSEKTYGQLIVACTQEGLSLCNELKLARQIKLDRLREKSQLEDFDEQFGMDKPEEKIPTKSRPCQMNTELVKFFKKEIDSLPQKGLIKPSKSPWSCTAIYVNNAAEKERAWIHPGKQPEDVAEEDEVKTLHITG